MVELHQNDLNIKKKIDTASYISTTELFNYSIMDLDIESGDIIERCYWIDLGAAVWGPPSLQNKVVPLFCFKRENKWSFALLFAGMPTCVQGTKGAGGGGGVEKWVDNSFVYSKALWSTYRLLVRASQGVLWVLPEAHRGRWEMKEYGPGGGKGSFWTGGISQKPATVVCTLKAVPGWDWNKTFCAKRWNQVPSCSCFSYHPVPIYSAAGWEGRCCFSLHSIK